MSEQTYTIDEFDRKLLRLLQKNARMKNTDLAKQLNVTEGAIRKRIKKLVDTNYIERFTVKLNDEKMQSTSAIVQIFIKGNQGPGEVRDEILEKVKGVEEIFEVTGDVDLFILFSTNSEYALKLAIEELRGIKGIENTQTFVALSRSKVDRANF